MSKSKLIHLVPPDVILPVENYTVEEDGKELTFKSNYKGSLEGAKLEYAKNPTSNIFVARTIGGNANIQLTLDQVKELIGSLQSMVDYVSPPIVVPPVDPPVVVDPPEEVETP